MNTTGIEHAANQDAGAGFGAEVSAEGASRKAALRKELEAARARYKQLLTSTSDERWGATTRSPKWTVGAVFAHIVMGIGTVPMRLNSARRGQALMVMPVFAFNFINVLASRRLAARYRPGTIGREFDAKYDAMMRLLDEVRDGEWEKVSHVYIQQQTVEEVFRLQAAHILAHLGDVTNP
jgi:hypothetical protein